MERGEDMSTEKLQEAPLVFESKNSFIEGLFLLLSRPRGAGH